ncbi:glycosyltransferase family 4 protein [Lihuaxuella thermophila]|uniref:Glycosyltransferase involved in cell wall bisynthesis n=1 Tax=Lihuaxuella thermophila TaxID=1173111 RepID=A0A1H8DZF9_9BACL|nr:glycosyltransferase family 4 protein [Lihuaxuella thermophila]SEN11918.1 Glycosyltransferase involved in cell wall bisynthesis [Lihuaxuella thermophila]
MNITFILPGYPSEPSGGFRVVYEYANHLVERGHEVSVVHPAYTYSSGHPIYRSTSPRIDWQYIHEKVRMIYAPSLDEKYIPDADAVIATAWFTADYVHHYSHRKGKKFYFIQSFVTWYGFDKVKRTWLLPLNKIVISKWLYQLGLKFGVPVTDITYIPNAIDHNKFRLINPISKRPKTIAMLYSRIRIKGSCDGIKALQLAKMAIPDLHAVLFGVPKRSTEIPGWMDYIQTPSQEDLVDKIYNGSSIYLCSSWNEGWGLPASEAMACGCAVVSTKNGGSEEFCIHNQTALLSPPKNPDELAKNLILLLKNDPLRMKIAENGLQYIRKFNYNKSTDLMESHLLSIVKQK